MPELPDPADGEDARRDGDRQAHTTVTLIVGAIVLFCLLCGWWR